RPPLRAAALRRLERARLRGDGGRPGPARAAAAPRLRRSGGVALRGRRCRRHRHAQTLRRARLTAMPAFASVDDVIARLRAEHYVCDRKIATAVYLPDRMEKPILVEGPAGVGKTELAKTLAATLGAELIRLQCYEGLDEAKSLYEWEYPKQLLYTQILRDK